MDITNDFRACTNKDIIANRCSLSFLSRFVTY